MKGVFEMPYSPTRSSTSRIRRVLLRESEQSNTWTHQPGTVQCITGVSVLTLALSALCQGLSFQETFSKAPLESLLLSIRYVLVLQQAVYAFSFNSLVTCEKTLQPQTSLFSITDTTTTLHHCHLCNRCRFYNQRNKMSSSESNMYTCGKKTSVIK